MTRAELHHLIDELPDDALDGTADLLRRITVRELDPDQAWVWTAKWQEKLREAHGDLAAGRVERYESSEEFLGSL